MKLTKKLITLYAVSALSFGLMACSDDSSSDSEPAKQDPVKTCTAGCNGNVATVCDTQNNAKTIDCAENGQVCKNASCVSAEEAKKCVPGCDGSKLTTCNGDKEVITDCADDKVCNPTTKACEDKIQDPVKTCTAGCNGNVATVCDEQNNATTTDCAKTNQVCKNASCVSAEEAKQCVPGCDRSKLTTCNGNKEVITDCADDKVCNPTTKACEDKIQDPVKTCTAGCNGNIATVCDEQNNATTTDCAKTNQICKNDACVFECEESFKTECASDNATRACVNNRYKVESCGEGKECKDGECKEDPCSKCSKSQICIDGKCEDTVAESAVGMPCTCEGDDCTIKISGKEITSVWSPNNLGALELMLNSLMSASLKKLENGGDIEAPNFFATKGISGCEKLVAHEGMTVGCFRDSTITFPESIKDIMKNDLGPLLQFIPKTGDDSVSIDSIIKFVNEIIDNGIQFTSPKGYCLAATIDIDGQIVEGAKNASLDNMNAGNFLKQDALSKNGLLKKINTGDHAMASKKTVKCPAGSEKLVYTINDDIDKFGHIDVGFDICLKQCITDNDCRKADGYSCVEIPNGVPVTSTDAEGNVTVVEPPKSKVCFDKKNIDYFTKMTESFSTKDASK